MVSRLNGKVSIITKVGEDSFGEDYINQFSKENVNIQGISKSIKSTGIASINVDKTGANTIIIIPGANNDLEVKDIIQFSTFIINSKNMLVLLEILGLLIIIA